MVGGGSPTIFVDSLCLSGPKKGETWCWLFVRTVFFFLVVFNGEMLESWWFVLNST